jgi:hypothetical protein
MKLAEPGIYGRSPFRLNSTLDDQTTTSITTDEGTNGEDVPYDMRVPDGYLDFSEIMRFADPTLASGDAALGGALCPADGSACVADPSSPLVEVTYTSKSEGACLEGGGVTVAAPCWVTDKKDLVLVLGTLTLPLKNTQFAGTFTGGPPPSNIQGGLMYGFLTQADADATNLPENIPPVAQLAIDAGAPLSTILRESEQSEVDGVKGWWFAVTYTAKTLAFAD